MIMNPEALRDFYEQQLFGRILPFWLERAADHAYGGYFTGFSNSGGTLLHTHKFTWSQGRFVWVWSRLANQFLHSPGRERYLKLAQLGAEFLLKYALLPDGQCSFVLSRAGKPILLDSQGQPRAARPGETYATSTFADCFVVYGLSEYARATGDPGAFEFAHRLFRSVEERLAAGRFRTEPYPTPPGYRQHGIPMIMLETARELALTADRFDPSLSPELRQRAQDFATQIMAGHRQADTGVVIEFLGSDGSVRHDMLGTYVNPGHTLECMWFVMHYAEEVQDAKLLREAVASVRRACELGWDDKYGGLLQFVHMEGGPPRGPVLPELEGSVMVEKLVRDWDSKLWWVHSEALYSLLLSYFHSQESWARDWYERVHEYTFRTFPAPEGEWIAIRNRDGTPADKVVALPVKDPFHVPRAFMHILRLLARPQWYGAGPCAQVREGRSI